MWTVLVYCLYDKTNKCKSVHKCKRIQLHLKKQLKQFMLALKHNSLSVFVMQNSEKMQMGKKSPVMFTKFHFYSPLSRK